MRIKNVLIPMLLCITTFCSCAQEQKVQYSKKTELNLNNLLIGKWHSESDSNYIIVFKKEKYSELYGRDTTGNMYYKLSTSCNLKDSSSNVTLQKCFLLFYSNDPSVQQCNEVLNLKSNILSWMNTKNGKIFIFRKIN